MKFALPVRLAALATVAFSAMVPFSSVRAALFGETEVDQDQFIAIAAPYGENNYNLLVLEQYPDKQECWATTGSAPVVVDPLLLNFDFTGICGRYADANGYSARVGDEDLGLDYLLRIVERDNELQLIASHRLDSGQPSFVIASTNGLTEGFLKLQLEPGWQFTKRTYEEQTLGHVYFSNDNLSLEPGDTSEVAFQDIRNDIYRSEISQAVELGFIAGFEDNTFRPNENLTREQLVSMVVEALQTLDATNINLPDTVATSPYPDVAASRWSAPKIAWAQQNDLISGYPDGTFKPTQPVTRAELIAVQRRAAEYAQRAQGQAPQLVATQEPVNFSDISNHWSSGLVSEMSAFCGVASPLNETGNAFYPDTAARRNYAAAATLRMLNCVAPDPSPTVEPSPTDEVEPGVSN
jgi:hypothetical protein